MTAALDHQLLDNVSRAYRLQHLGIKVDGTPFDLSRYPYLIDMVDRRARRKTVIKGAQLGFTSIFTLDAIMSAWEENLRGILYLFPTDNDVLDYSKARFSPMVLENPVFSKLVNDTDSAGLKRIANSFVYFRAAGAIGASTKASLSKLKSIPVDRLYLDERDEMQDKRVDAAEHRLDGSFCPEQVELSTPTIPGYGVDLSYKESDQRAWHWKCSHCGDWTCLELNWPDCIAEPIDGEPHFLCMHCRQELSRDKGQWVAAREGIDNHLGYWVSQLSSPTKSAADILSACARAEGRGRKRDFYTQVLARAFAEIEDQLTPEIIGDCLTETPRSRNAEGPCAMGADPGASDIHYLVKQRISDSDSEVLDFGRCAGFDDLIQIAKRFNVRTGVIDQMAERRAVRRFIDAHHGWWGCQYAEGRKGPYHWDHREHVVTVHRTEALDASHFKFVEKREHLPAPDERYHDLLVPQLCNMARVMQEDAVTGDVLYRWVIVGGVKNDHLKHAHAYATIAEERVGLAQSVERARQMVHLPRKRRGFMAL